MKLCCISAMVESNAFRRNIKVCGNSELILPAVNSVKRGNFFVIRTLGKVHSAGRVTLLSGTTFVHINRAMICINVSNCFYVFLKNWPFNMNATFEVWPVNSSFWTEFDRSDPPLF